MKHSLKLILMLCVEEFLLIKELQNGDHILQQELGGSCFKKDAMSLAAQLLLQNTDNSFVEMVNNINEKHKYT